MAETRRKQTAAGDTPLPGDLIVVDNDQHRLHGCIGIVTSIDKSVMHKGWLVCLTQGRIMKLPSEWVKRVQQ